MSASPFLQNIREHMLVERYSRRTVDSYLHWIKRYILFCNKVHPAELGGTDVQRFLTHLAVNRSVSASTQATAVNALAFLYNKYLHSPLDFSRYQKAKQQAKLPVVLTEHEVKNLLAELSGKVKLMACLMYGSGLRRIEVVRLRVHDIDIEHLQIRVWNGKGGKHRLTTLAPELLPALSAQTAKVALQLEEDLLNPSFAGVHLPNALNRKFTKASKNLGPVNTNLAPLLEVSFLSS
ncbi:phage integrase N-terminal SAM-like domain-containing protein [Halioxenophilus sp. WMMB6]|uniref:phage integrase N-terminal SAM-like domain-containing protein n=1 Tax=Halioxenophilus sp. WMMB6 TaxID=3073815 RepID=UPI00295E5661|nr:phage integrase N-terminal SAM-like domain-containing protein [Halioxenophilus sp. WMMB6]